jgi:sialate O-acetylesterase
MISHSIGRVRAKAGQASRGPFPVFARDGQGGCLPFIVLIFPILLLGASILRGEINLPSQFSDHMVFQRDMKVPVWGTAVPAETVTVEFAGQKKSVEVAANGKWRVNLDPMPALPEGRALIVSGSKEKSPVRFEDVLVGEVWLCSGQSNMDFTVARTEKYYYCGVTNEAEEVAAATYPEIRMFTGDWARTYEPRSNIPGCAWKVCTPESVREFSAIGYFFARDLQKELKVPVGILTLTYGASTAQAWIRREALAASPQLAPMLAQFDADVKAAETQTNRIAREAALAKWDASVAKAKAAGKKAPRRPRVFDPVQDQHSPTVMFNGVIAPVIPFAIRGVLWYQGESITTGGVQLYPLLQSTLIQDWRRLWGAGDFPFYICQLAAYKNPVTDPNSPGSIPATREAQATVLALTNTGMAVTIDIGDAGNVHPKNKQEVGNRLMRIALAKVYGRPVECSGPMYESMKVEGGAIRVKFSHAAGGLVARGGPLKQFAVAGSDHKFVWAKADIVGKDEVVVTSPEVPQPVAARYAWADNPEGCSLYNAENLPAAPFRTDTP